MSFLLGEPKGVLFLLMDFLFTIFVTLKTHTVIQWDKGGYGSKGVTERRGKILTLTLGLQGAEVQLCFTCCAGLCCPWWPCKLWGEGVKYRGRGWSPFPSSLQLRWKQWHQQGRETGPQEEGWRDLDRLIIYSSFELLSIWKKKNGTPYYAFIWVLPFPRGTFLFSGY